MATVMLWTLLWISGYCHRLSAEVSVQYKYFLSGERQGVSLQAPAETNGTEFIWEWTSHDGRYTNARIITIQSDGKFSWNLPKANESISKDKDRTYDISLRREFQNAGVFTFIQTKPENVKMAQFEVFAVKVEPLLWNVVHEGSDANSSCEVSHLPDSATLDWERDRGSTANTTLIYNNTAHIIIHSVVDRYNGGTYKCTLRCNGALVFSITRKLQVYKGTYGTQHTLYRGSLNSNEVMLICHSSGSYRKASWKWEPLSRTNVTVASADKDENALISMEVDKERFSFEGFDGLNFPLRISPVKFGDSGRYFCYMDTHSFPMVTITLVTVQVSAVPPGGLSRNQSVELNCEISQVIGSVILAWLRMKGARGELVKQEVLSEGRPKKMLSLTLPILSRDQLHWACAVFIESMLRAQVPLHLTLPTPITEPEETTPITEPGETTPITEPEETKPDNVRMLVMGLACAAAVCVGALLLLGGLLFRHLKTSAGPSTSPAGGNGAADPVYSNVTYLRPGQGNQDTPEEENDSVELQYLRFPLTSLDPHRQQRRQVIPRSRSEREENDKVIYSNVRRM